MVSEIKQLTDKLNAIKSELDYIKRNMVEKDEIMNHEEFLAYKRSFKEDNLVSLEEAEKDLDS